MHKGQQLLLLCSLGLIVGALLPWVTVRSVFGTVTRPGIEGDGAITGGFGVLLLIAAVVHKGRAGRFYSWSSAVLAMVAGLIVLSDMVGSARKMPGVESEYVVGSLGLGMYVSIIGALLGTIGGFLRVPGERTPS